ncbi:MAG: citramalate synthase [Spirochaetes bacterium GWF1_51_8]|nr:MAG: citramalate synthase [Spirochaetes bacterium GWF1_51_8]
MSKVTIYDTTLRDGKQAEGINFSMIDMISIAKKLDEFGIDYIECGWPGALPKDKAFFQEIKKVELKNTKIAAFGSTRHAKNKVIEDNNIKELLLADTPTVTIFGKAWDLHVTDVFNISLDANIEMIYDSVAYLKDSGREVFFDAEHFFDGFKENPDYAMKVLKAASDAGASCLVLCDTNGGSLPSEIQSIIKKLSADVKVPLGIHAHNDGDLAIANSIEAIQAGAVQVQGTINGIGERTGNANLCSIIPNLVLKMNCTTQHIDKDRLKKLEETSRYIYEIANLNPENKQPFVGLSAFAHKAGVHVNAVQKNPRTYEHIPPETVGNRRRILISEQAGKSNILAKVQELGLEISADKIAELSQHIKELENTGYEFEGADASFEILVKKLSGQFQERFKVHSYKILNYIREGIESMIEGTVKIRVGEMEELTVAEGDGPINALDTALKQALSVFYPVVKDIRLMDYKVRILDPGSGTAAVTRVLITFRYHSYEWGTVGVSGNIIQASWEALVDSMNYILMRLETEEDGM